MLQIVSALVALSSTLAEVSMKIVIKPDLRGLGSASASGGAERIAPFMRLVSNTAAIRGNVDAVLSKS